MRLQARRRCADLALVLGSSAILALAATSGGLIAPPGLIAEGSAHTALGWMPHSLSPVANPDPDAPPQPSRCRPYHVAVSHDRDRAFVTLAGKESAPGSELAVLDLRSCSETGRIRVGSMPYGLTLHPEGRWLLVTNRFSNYLSVVDVAGGVEVGKIPVPYYCEDIVCSPDGDTAYASNFWKDQVIIVDLRVVAGTLTGRMRDFSEDREDFLGVKLAPQRWLNCLRCGYRERWSPSAQPEACAACGRPGLVHSQDSESGAGTNGARSALRSQCGTSGCHLNEAGGFYAGADAEHAWRSALAHAMPHDPESSLLLRAVTSTVNGGWADSLSGRHHPGGVVFEDPANDLDYAAVRDWIAAAHEGPGIAVGVKPRDLVLAPDGRTLYVANTGSLDVSVVDLETLRERARIFTSSPVNDLVWMQGRLIFSTLGVGSGFPKQHDPGRESFDREHPDAEFTLFRDPATGKPLPLEKQETLGPYDAVDGTAQEKFRDITNDLVILDPAVTNVGDYAVSEAFTRYTSDSFETLPGDKKGEVPPELMKVVGAFPEQIASADDRIYVTMSGTFQVQEWLVDADAAPSERLTPGRVFDVGFKPVGIAVGDGVLVVADHLSESVSLVDLATGDTERISLSRLPEPFPATEFELGEFFVQTSVFSVDQDQSCVHCHYRDTGDGKKWSVSQVMGQGRDGSERTGGSRELNDIRGLVLDVPFFVEGTLSINEPLTMMMEHNPLVDFQGVTPAGDFNGIFVQPEEESRYARSADAVVVASGRWQQAGITIPDLIKRREIHFGNIAERWLGRRIPFRDFQRFIGDYQGGEGRFLPNPTDPEDPMVERGRSLFNDPRVGCSGCHPAPNFTDKVRVYNQNRSFPPLVTPAPRDNIHHLISADRIDHLNGFVRPWDPDDLGRVEEREGFFVAPSLRGLWARTQGFLHHGAALNAREIVCPPGHPALRTFPFERRDQERPGRWERGLNERHGMPDTHGTTSHLTVWDVECLLRYVLSIE